jgi:hypothetical protein
VTFTISLLGSGNAMTLTHDLPASLSAPLTPPNSTSGVASYDAASRRVTWRGTLSAGTPATLIYPVSVLTAARQAIHNTAILTDAVTGPTSSTAILIANGFRVYLPLARK